MGKPNESKQYVRDLRLGDAVHTPLMIKSRKIIELKNKPGRFMVATLADITGEISAKVGGPAFDEAAAMRNGSIALVKGMVQEFAGMPQVNVTHLEAVHDFQEDDFFFIDHDRIKKMREELIKVVAALQPGPSRELGLSFIRSEWFDSFCYAPAAKSIHHNYPGGLLDHTLGVMKICRVVADSREGIDGDLMVLGALFHDIGKVKEMEYLPVIDYTDEGKLLGHIVLGIEMAGDLISRNRIGDSGFRTRVLHMIASHHGEYEWQSPKRPKFLEARLLHLADMMDADIYKFKNVVPEEEGGKWSEFIRSIGNQVYLGGD